MSVVEKTNNTRDMTRYPLAMFVCDNGEIISLLGRCDNNQDCDDGTDERNCPDTTGTIEVLKLYKNKTESF